MLCGYVLFVEIAVREHRVSLRIDIQRRLLRVARSTLPGITRASKRGASTKVQTPYAFFIHLSANVGEPEAINLTNQSLL